MINITPQDVLTQLRGIVAEYGEEYVYEHKPLYPLSSPTCNYVDGEGGDCIVGHYLLRKGVPIERLVQADNAGGGTGLSASDLLARLIAEGVVVADVASIDMLAEAQYVQDSRKTWGKALAAAERVLKAHEDAKRDLKGE